MKPKHKGKNKTYARYRWREKHKKQYTFTKTKFVIGFLISLFSSIFLGSYFDKYGSIVMSQSVDAFKTAISDDGNTELAGTTSDKPLLGTDEISDSSESLDEDAEIDAIEERARAVQISQTETKRVVEIRASRKKSLSKSLTTQNSFPSKAGTTSNGAEGFDTKEFEAITFTD